MERPTIVKLESKARRAILNGVNAIVNAAKLTLGPDSGSALIPSTYNRGPRIEDDGHFTAQAIEPKDPAERLVSQTFRETASKTNAKAGDGTTTTMVMGASIINTTLQGIGEVDGAYAVIGGSSPHNVRKISKELLASIEPLKEEIKKRAKKVESVEELEKIASVSVGDQDLGKVIAGIVWETGIYGYVDVVEGYKDKIETETLKAMRFPAKVPARAFVNRPERFEMVAEDCAVLVTNHKLDNDVQVGQLITNILNSNPKLIIIAESFSTNILQNLVKTVRVNMANGVPRALIFPVAVPSLQTSRYEDIATYCGAEFVNKDTGKKLENVKGEDLGFLGKLVVKETEAKEDAVAIDGRGTKEGKMKVANSEYAVSSKVAEHIKVLQGQLAEEKIDSHKKLLERRIASMASAVGVIRVGATSQAESLPKKLKIEDAVYACKGALEEGYVRGGGLCLKEIAETVGNPILKLALEAPYRQIQENAGGKLEVGDDIFDSAKATRCAVEHAISVAANLITVKCIVAEEPDMGPADGYKQIASAIMLFAKFFAKREGIMRENELEMEKDMLQRFEMAEIENP